MRFQLRIHFLALAALAALAPAAFAQLGNFKGIGEVAGVQSSPPAISARILPQPGEENRGTLAITALIPKGFHIYSISQPKGGPLPTKVTLTAGPYKLLGNLHPNVAPKVSAPTIEAWSKVKQIEEHEGVVAWSAPIEVEAGTNLASLKIQGAVTGQVCKEASCELFDVPFEATLSTQPEIASTDAPAAGEEEVAKDVPFRAEKSSVAISGHIVPRTVEPGGWAWVVLTATPDKGWHIYATADKTHSRPGVGRPTLIVLDQPGKLKAFRANTKSPVHKAPGLDGKDVESHEEAVTWAMPIQIPADAKPGAHPISGVIGYQVCKDTSCEPLQGARFNGRIDVGAKAVAGRVPLEFSAAEKGFAAAAKFAETAAYEDAPAEERQPHQPGVVAADMGIEVVPLPAAGFWTLLGMVGAALLGGFILNFMPCVLPVVGLKVQSFVAQLGHGRREAVIVNLWYSAGIIAVFLVLGTLASLANLFWGEQFTNLGFKVGLTGFVFVLALSFLGVWEIPIPGFVGRGKAAELASREGALGSFFKGGFSTIMSTPCSGPFLGSLFSYTAGRPLLEVYLLFTAMGLGMASPYLLISAYPSLVRVIPKPGAWMETFKNAMGFVLLGSVVMLFAGFSKDYFIPTLAFLFGLWFCCWIIGRAEFATDWHLKARAWGIATAVGLAIGIFSFTVLAPGGSKYLVPDHAELPWKDYSRDEIKKAKEAGKTVLVDFTAGWCYTCQVNSIYAINREPVRNLVEQNGVATFLADWTDRDDAIKKQIEELNSKSIPLLAIYPAGQPENVIVLRDLITMDKLLEALKQAGPSIAQAAPAEPAPQQAQVGPPEDRAARLR